MIGRSGVTMVEQSRLRHVATAAGYASAGVTALGMLATGVVIGQALIARRTIPTAEHPPPRCDGRYGFEHPGEPVRLAVLGDSSAAGYGVDAPRKTLGALLAAGLAEQLKRPVDLRCVAVVGAQSRHLAPQVERLLDDPPDLAVILIGGNDVTHRSNVPDAVRALGDAVRALRMVNTDVVVGTCPDMGAIEPIQPPLKWLAHRWSRQLAALQTIAVVEAGGRTVSLGDLLGPQFAADPQRMFGWDRFHPSAEGYVAAAGVLLPSMVSALAEPAGPRPAEPDGAGVRNLYAAAAKAAEQSGIEVAPATVAGRERGPHGRWAHLRRRAWRSVGRPTDPAHVP
ncbi:SGNH/GDSL hydrolase family protein [Virgisporangium ochraceum]